jgi:hypothetical protein
MTGTDRNPELAFRALRRTLWRRRLDRLDTRLRVELIAISVLVSAFVLWRGRNPFDHARRAFGPGRTGLEALAILIGLAAIGGALAGVRHLRALRGGPAGPPWLALPVPPHLLARHLAAESRAHALWIVPIALGTVGATIGLIPVAWIVGLAAAFVWSLLECSRLGCATALRIASRAPVPVTASGATAVERALVAARAETRARSVGPARWRMLPPAVVLWRKDLLLSVRPTAARRRLGPALTFLALSIAVWFLPLGSLLTPLDREDAASVAHFVAFALSLAAAGSVGEWLIALSGEDPYAVLRVLPVGVEHVWLSRAASALVFAVIAVAAQAAAARPLSPEALQYLLVWIGGATLMITLLGVNYGITLFPRHDLAQRFYAVWLGFSIAASLMIPLMGWLVLIAAVIHSALKLRHWAQREEAA